MNFRKLIRRVLLGGVMLLLTACGFHHTTSAGEYFTPENQAALADASANGRTDTIKQLLANGAQVNFQGKSGMTALLWAIVHQSKPGFECLLENGADPNLQLNVDDPKLLPITIGNSPMSVAAQFKDPWYLGMVLKHGGNPNLVNPARAMTPIDQSIESSLPEQVKTLIAAGANLNFLDRDGNTPMIIAAMENKYDMVYDLLEAGADPSIIDKWGKTLVYFIGTSRTAPATEDYQWRSKVVDFLKAKGIDVPKVGAGPSTAPIININSTPEQYLQNNQKQ